MALVVTLFDGFAVPPDIFQPGGHTTSSLAKPAVLRLAILLPVVRLVKATFVMLILALAAHLDWHAARPTSHHLSLGLSWHWLLAVPVFGFVAWFVNSAWPVRPLTASVAIIGGGLLLGAVAEPAWEYWVEQAPFEWAFGSLRNLAAVAFAVSGIITYLLFLWLRRSRRIP